MNELENDDEKLAQRILLEAKDLIRDAERALEERKPDVSEELYRRSLTKIRQAFLLDRKKETSIYLHNIGRLVHSQFGCVLPFRDGNYWVECPVELSHGKYGFSIAGSGRSLCSICGENTLDCYHVSGRSYDQVVAKRIQNMCNICGEEKECPHVEGVMYDGVGAFSIVVELDLSHVALVENPANPLCTIYGHTLTESDILKTLPKSAPHRFVYGKTRLYCHHCSKCSGIQ